MKDHEILSAFTKILTQYGPDSPEEEEFLDQHKDNPELVELMGLASTLKRALTKKPAQDEKKIPTRVG